MRLCLELIEIETFHRTTVSKDKFWMSYGLTQICEAWDVPRIAGEGLWRIILDPERVVIDPSTPLFSKGSGPVDLFIAKHAHEEDPDTEAPSEANEGEKEKPNKSCWARLCCCCCCCCYRRRKKTDKAGTTPRDTPPQKPGRHEIRERG